MDVGSWDGYSLYKGKIIYKRHEYPLRPLVVDHIRMCAVGREDYNRYHVVVTIITEDGQQLSPQEIIVNNKLKGYFGLDIDNYLTNIVDIEKINDVAGMEFLQDYYFGYGLEDDNIDWYYGDINDKSSWIKVKDERNMIKEVKSAMLKNLPEYDIYDPGIFVRNAVKSKGKYVGRGYKTLLKNIIEPHRT
jgi:hypothetical protein